MLRKQPKSELQNEPLHRQLTALLRREIALRRKPGDRLESQNELARRFNVSVLTVREALSGLAEEGIIQRRRGSGTFVTDPTRNQWLGVLMEMDIAHPCTATSFRRIVQRLRLGLRERGHRVRLYAGYVAPYESFDFTTQATTCDDFIDDLNAGRLRGVAVVTGISQAVIEELKALSVPVVGSGSDPFVTHQVCPPQSLISIGLQYLHDRGRRKVAVMGWGNSSAVLAAARQVGLELRPEWIRCDVHPALPGAGWEEFREIWSALREKPDGLLVTDDVLFADAAPALIEAGVRIPDELLVVTDACKGAHYPVPFPIVRIENDPEATADAMVRILCDLVEGKEVPRRTEGPPLQLVEPQPGDPSPSAQRKAVSE